jgi:hypothetical protein
MPNAQRGLCLTLYSMQSTVVRCPSSAGTIASLQPPSRLLQMVGHVRALQFRQILVLLHAIATTIGIHHHGRMPGDVVFRDVDPVEQNLHVANRGQGAALPDQHPPDSAG